MYVKGLKSLIFSNNTYECGTVIPTHLVSPVVMGRTKFEVPCSIFRSQKQGVRVQLAKDEYASPFNVWKSDVWVCLMNNRVKAVWVWCLMSVCSKPKFRCLSSIINRWTCSSLSVVQKMMFELVWWSTWLKTSVRKRS